MRIQWVLRGFDRASDELREEVILPATGAIASLLIYLSPIASSEDDLKGAIWGEIDVPMTLLPRLERAVGRPLPRDLYYQIGAEECGRKRRRPVE